MPKRIGTSASESLFGTAQRDIMRGNGGDDFLYGRAGSDILNGGRGADQIFGRSGDDLIRWSRGADQIFGGTGVDTVSYRSAFAGVQILGDGIVFHDFSTAPAFGQNAAVGQKLQGIERIKLSQFNDRLVYDDAELTVHAGRGADYIVGASLVYGGKGADRIEGQTIFGGAGRDVLTGDDANGGVGDDTIAARRAWGGDGADTFVFEDEQRDHVIRDFDSSEGDLVRFVERAVDTNFTFRDFDEMLAATETEHGHSVISWDGGSLKIRNTDKSALMADWFEFDIA